MIFTILFILIAGFTLYYLVAPAKPTTEIVSKNELFVEANEKQSLQRGQDICLTPRQH